MGLYKNTDTAASSLSSLESFISSNIIALIDYSNKPFKIVEEDKAEINTFITDKGTLLRDLDYTKEDNISFILSLYDLCQRFGFLNAIRINKILEKNNVELSRRLQAVNLFLVGVRKPQNFIERFGDICENLQFSLEYEEDNNIRIDLTFANYLLAVVKNAQLKYTKAFFDCLDVAVNENKYPFLKSDFIIALNDLTIDENLTSHIYSLIDNYITKEFKTPEYNKSLLLEQNTSYVDLLESITLNFDELRRISVDVYNKIGNSAIFYSLNRGVGILENENQLYAYMHSYGNMHYRKLISGFEELDEDFFNKDVQIIDWGCGQAMATFTFYDFLKKSKINCNVIDVTLIEPSEIALKRGALHVKKSFPDAYLTTISKELDFLEASELHNISSAVKLHIFSNILDVDFFSIGNLINTLENSYKETNYFICVSPYVTELKKNRLNLFAKAFSNYPNYEMIINVDNREGQWERDWTRVLRVFKADIV